MDNLSWQVGDVSITRVEESQQVIPAGFLLSGITQRHLDDAPWLDPFFADDVHMRLSIHTFVVRSAGMVIVVDTCVGPSTEKMIAGDPQFLGRLDAEIDGGLDAVDIVLCTHLHFDHVGWNTRPDADGGLVPTFPNARYLFSARDLAYLDEEGDSMDVKDGSIQPILDADLATPVEADHVLTDEVRLVATPGHTPGHVAVLIESAGATALITGDMMHSPAQVTYPELAATSVDWDSTASTATRRRVVDTYADTEVLILGAHFPPPTGGTIHRPPGAPARFE